MKIIYQLAFLCVLQFLASCDKSVKIPQPFLLAAPRDSAQTHKTDNPAVTRIIFSSADGGQTWQNISEGLPKLVKDNYGVSRIGSFTDDKEIYVSAYNEIYRRTANSTAPFWTNDAFPKNYSSIASDKASLVAYNHGGGGLFQKTNAKEKWSAVFANFKEQQIFNVVETAGGTIFIGTDRGLFKSTNNGQSWKQLAIAGLGKMVELDGVLLATSQSGIVRSTDDGEHWAAVISEGGVGIDVERIDGGFAAITYSTFSKTRRIRTSYDGGTTWQAIDAGLPASMSVSSMIQVGEHFFCGHPDGIYQSADKGKTWKRILCPMDGKVFHLSVSGDVMYAILRDTGC